MLVVIEVVTEVCAETPPSDTDMRSIGWCVCVCVSVVVGKGVNTIEVTGGGGGVERYKR